MLQSPNGRPGARLRAITLVAALPLLLGASSDLNAQDHLFAAQVDRMSMAQSQIATLAMSESGNVALDAYAGAREAENDAALADVEALDNKYYLPQQDAGDPEDRAVYQMLSALHGPAFETAYISAQAGLNARETAVYKAEIAQGSNGDFVALAKTQLAIVTARGKATATLAKAVKSETIPQSAVQNGEMGGGY